MPSFIRNTSGGKAISGGALAPRSRRASTAQVDGYWRGGSVSNPPATVEVLAAGGGKNGDYYAYPNTGFDGGGGGFTTYNATTPVSAGIQYTITVGGQNTASSAVLGATVTGATTATRTGNGNGGNGTSALGSGNAGSAGTSGALTITGVSRGHGGGGGGGARKGAGYGASGGSGGAGGVENGLANGGSGSRGGGGGGSADATIYGGGAGGNGGGGEVIIAYPDSFGIAAATTGSPSYDNATRAGYHVYIFTGSGTITF